MEEIIKYLEEIKKHQMQTVQLARSTEVYKLADKALKAITVIHCCKSDSEQLFCYSCQAWTSHKHINENNVRCLMCDTNKAK